MEKKQGSLGKKILTVLLAVVLTLLVFMAYVLIRMASVNIETDDVDKILNTEPMTADDRYSANDEDDLVIRLDEGDLYYYLSKDYGKDFISIAVEEAAKSSGLKIDAYKLEIQDGKPMITVTGKYAFLKLAASAVLEGEPYNGNSIMFKVAKIKVAGMSLPTSWIKGLSDISFDVKADTYFLKSIKEVSGEGEYVCLIGELNDEMLEKVDPSRDFPKNYIYYLKDCREIMDAANIFATDREGAIHIFMEGVRQLGFAKVIDDYFLSALPRSSKAMMRSEVLNDRLLHEYEGTDFVAFHQETTQFVEEGRKNIDRLTDQVFRYFNLKRISIKDGKFYYGDKEFGYEDIVFEGWEDYYAGLIKPETFHLVLIDDPKSFKGNVGALSSHIDSPDSIAEKVNVNDKYTLGYVVETVGGLKTVCYNGMNSRGTDYELKVYDLSEEEYERLASGDKVNIYHHSE